MFRASKRYLQLKLLKWGGGQVSTLISLIAALVVLHLIGTGTIEVPSELSDWGIDLGILGWFEIIGVVFFLAQVPFSLVPVILDWEMRWYIVTDRSLRIREGVWKVSEMTMTFDNVQEVSIRQGPIERLFGIANLRVRTAGGGGRSNTRDRGRGKIGHVGYFRGVDNAPAIRDLVLEPSNASAMPASAIPISRRPRPKWMKPVGHRQSPTPLANPNSKPAPSAARLCGRLSKRPDLPADHAD